VVSCVSILHLDRANKISHAFDFLDTNHLPKLPADPDAPSAPLVPPPVPPPPPPPRIEEFLGLFGGGG